MPVEFSKGEKMTVNHPIQLGECSCEIVEGNDKAEGKLIKCTYHQAESSISILDDKGTI